MPVAPALELHVLSPVPLPAAIAAAVIAAARCYSSRQLLEA